MFILSGCSDPRIDSLASDNEVSSLASDFQKFKTEDGKIEISIFNTGSFSKDTVNEIKKETLNFYNMLQKENIPMSPPSTIYLHLNNAKKISYTNENTIHLYWINEEKYPLIHELTHVIFGYTEGHLTQEGLAIFMQDSYSDIGAFPNFQADVHEIMKYLITQDIRIPLETLLTDDKIFTHSTLTKDSYSLRWLGYIESASFSNFLIKQYGMEKFLNIYNRPNLADEIQSVYGKKIEKLEMEWNKFVRENSTLNEDTIHNYDSTIQEIFNHIEVKQ